MRKVVLLDNKNTRAFSVDLANMIGLNEALFLNQVHYWIDNYNDPDKKNEFKVNHHREGRCWVFNTVDKWQEQFPFWCTKTISRAIANLVSSGLLIEGNFNERNWDRTKWYTIDYGLLNRMVQGGYVWRKTDKKDEKGKSISEWTKSPNAEVQNDQKECDKKSKAIPKTTLPKNTLPENNSNIPINSTSSNDIPIDDSENKSNDKKESYNKYESSEHSLYCGESEDSPQSEPEKATYTPSFPYQSKNNQTITREIHTYVEKFLPAVVMADEKVPADKKREVAKLWKPIIKDCIAFYFQSYSECLTSEGQPKEEHSPLNNTVAYRAVKLFYEGFGSKHARTFPAWEYAIIIYFDKYWGNPNTDLHIKHFMSKGIQDFLDRVITDIFGGRPLEDFEKDMPDYVELKEEPKEDPLFGLDIFDSIFNG